MKLLIVDDVAAMRSFLRELCAGISCQTVECCDGAEAIAAYHQFTPDWTLMDITMPVVDGLTATARIVELHPGARIVVLTENDGQEYGIAARKAGARAFLRKDDLHQLPALLTSTTPNPLPTNL